MKKRIIALILACVMSLLALASCGAASFNFAEDSIEYVSTENLGEFLKAIKEIKIDDADFTTNEDTRWEKVLVDIYASLTSAAVTEDEKLAEGNMSKQDVLYFAYYCTYDEKDADGNVTATYTFKFDQMKDALITTGSSTVKAEHVIELGTAGDGDAKALKTKLYNAIMEKFGDADTITLKGEVDGNAIDILYDTDSATGTAVSKDSNNVIVISYTRSYSDANGDTKTEKVLYKTIDLAKTYDEGTEEAKLVELMLNEKATLKVGSDLTYVTKKDDGTEEKQSVFSDVEIGGVKYKYSEIGIEWVVKKDNGEFVTFTHAPYTTSTKLEPDGLHNSGFTVDLKDKELTYHVYPVSFIDVPEFTDTASTTDAYNIIKYVLDSDITADTIEFFTNEKYKSGDKTVKTLVEELVKLYKEDTETLKNFKNEAKDKTLDALKTAKTEAANALKAGDKTDTTKYAELEAADKAATEAYNDALEYNINSHITAIVEAKDGEAVAATEIVKEYKKSVYDILETRYNTAIIDAVGDELWKLIDKYFPVKSYPEEMVKEFYNHIYEQHEYNFYNGKYSTSSTSTSTESNYKHYKGDLKAYLVDVTKATNNDYEAAITASAKEYLKPLLQIFALSKALEDTNAIDVVKMMEDYTKADEAAGAYKVYSHDGHNHGEAEAKEEEENMREAYEKALADTKHFLVDDEALKAYKKNVGKATYDAYIDNYGETNVRATLQANRLMYLLLCTDITYDEDGVEHISYKTVGEGESVTKVISFRTVVYTLNEKTDDANK